MLTPEQRKSRIENAKELGKLLSAFDRVDDYQRSVVIHNEIEREMEQIFERHADGKCFNEHQKNCLSEIAFGVVHWMDPRGQPPKALWKRVWKEYRALGAMAQIGTAVAVVMTMSGVVDTAFRGARFAVWIYGEATAAPTAAAPPAPPTPAVAPSQAAPVPAVSGPPPSPAAGTGNKAP